MTLLIQTTTKRLTIMYKPTKNQINLFLKNKRGHSSTQIRDCILSYCKLYLESEAWYLASGWKLPCLIEAYPDVVSGLKGHKDYLAYITTSEDCDNLKTVEKGSQPLSLDPTVSWQLEVVNKWKQLLNSAKKRGKEFNLLLGDVDKLLKQKTCYYTEVEFNDSENFSRTIDRVDPEKGYVRGNVVAATYFANQAKEQLFERPSIDLNLNIDLLYQIVDKVREFENDL